MRERKEKGGIRERRLRKRDKMTETERVNNDKKRGKRQ